MQLTVYVHATSTLIVTLCVKCPHVCVFGAFALILKHDHDGNAKCADFHNGDDTAQQSS